MSKHAQEILMQANTVFENIMNNTAAKTLLAEYSYDDAKLAAGLALFERAKLANTNRNQQYSEQYAATNSFQHLLNTARKIYIKQSQIARLALADTPVAYNQLGLKGPRGQSFSKLADQVSLFYDNSLLDSTILAKLTTFGLDQAKLNAGKASFEAAQTARAKQKRDMTEAVTSTQTRDKAISDISTWISLFIRTAALALEDEPEVLASMGI